MNVNGLQRDKDLEIFILYTKMGGNQEAILKLISHKRP